MRQGAERGPEGVVVLAQTSPVTPSVLAWAVDEDGRPLRGLAAAPHALGGPAHREQVPVRPALRRHVRDTAFEDEAHVVDVEDLLGTAVAHHQPAVATLD